MATASNTIQRIAYRGHRRRGIGSANQNIMLQTEQIWHGQFLDTKTNAHSQGSNAVNKLH